MSHMKLSVRGEYALRALIVLGLNYGKPVVPIQTISKQQNIPKRFLEQILNDLRSAGVPESKRGIKGGYRLARPPEKITDLDWKWSDDPKKNAEKQTEMGQKFVHDWKVQSLQSCSSCHR